MPKNTQWTTRQIRTELPTWVAQANLAASRDDETEAAMAYSRVCWAMARLANEANDLLAKIMMETEDTPKSTSKARRVAWLALEEERNRAIADSGPARLAYYLRNPHPGD